MARLGADYPAAPIPGTESLGRYPADGDDDARQVWLMKYQRAAQGIPDFPDNDKLELEYFRVTFDSMCEEQDKEIERRTAANRVNYERLADHVVETITPHVDKRIMQIVETLTAGVNGRLLPHLSDRSEQVALLRALEARQQTLEFKLRLLAGEAGLQQRMAEAERLAGGE